ncbi:hypothetical protein GFH30_06340 [Acinetobacter wanghuae]|uniref:Coil containing protein n=1 Tax=Acinetobacter wanghuae TaxID=2662362 RepID=A0ABX6CZR8_9GAMM|nr:hypothetical protein [Acinetobacter wanghuae]QGA11031.1 hypothetical protein GFH30_06340 [Acinetobacter wanghuae]
MSAITWSLNDERSDIFDGWGVVRGRLFELGDCDMSIEKVYEVIKGYQCSELLMVLNPALAVWNHQQKEIDSLKAQLNNMERCYIEKKKQLNDVRAYIESTCPDGLVSEIDRIVEVKS